MTLTRFKILQRASKRKNRLSLYWQSKVWPAKTNKKGWQNNKPVVFNLAHFCL
jgi:hypothetical protein